MDEIYFGNKKVTGTQTLDEKLETGAALIEVSFSDGTKEVMSMAYFGAGASKESLDPTQLQEKIIDAIHPELAKFLLSWGLPVNWIGVLFDWCVNSFNLKLQDADKIVWGKKRSEITLTDMSRLLSKVTLKEVLNKDN